MIYSYFNCIPAIWLHFVLTMALRAGVFELCPAEELFVSVVQQPLITQQPNKLFSDATSYCAEVGTNSFEEQEIKQSI